MSSQSLEKKDFIPLGFENFKEDSINFNKIVIPFSKFGTTEHITYIYEGFEKISFKKRHPIYKSIFLDEFAN